MTAGQLPPTPYEPPWWDGISFKPHGSTTVVAATKITPATGAQAARAALHDKLKPPWRAVTDEMLDEAQNIETVGASSPDYVIAYVTIGNSDDKLEQHAWSNFIRELKGVLSDLSGRTYGEWYSAPDSTWQNMCICKEVRLNDLPRLRAALRALRRFYQQDSVALVTSGRTELV